MNKTALLLVGVTAMIFLASCGDIGVFEKNRPIAAHQWSAQESIQDSFQIVDTVSAYQLYVIIRHTDAYKYNNIWLKVDLNGPGGFQKTDKFDFSLGNDAQGWEGTGMNDIWEVRKRITVLPYRFHQIGTYHYSLSQIMRDNPLEHVMSVGFRVEKLR